MYVRPAVGAKCEVCDHATLHHQRIDHNAVRADVQPSSVPASYDLYSMIKNREAVYARGEDLLLTRMKETR
jgi:hypothetical protein